MGIREKMASAKKSNWITQGIPEAEVKSIVQLAKISAQIERCRLDMEIHQHDADANDLQLYYQSVINWAKMMFLTVRKGMTDSQDWGLLYNKYHDKQYNSNALETDIQKLLVDDDVTKNAGVIPYVLSDRTKHDEKISFYPCLYRCSEAQSL